MHLQGRHQVFDTFVERSTIHQRHTVSSTLIFEARTIGFTGTFTHNGPITLKLLRRPWPAGVRDQLRSVNVSERVLREVFLYPFKEALERRRPSA